MANPKKSKVCMSTADGKPCIADRATNVPSYDITWSANEPTAGSTATIADGDTPTVAELGQAVADITAKLNLLIAALEDHGLMEDDV
jgi:hypothetical protein